jgi:ATP phosphoribosyltransferase regulatory subunit
MTRALVAPIPPGALDLTGDAVRRRRTLQRAAMSLLEATGYAEVSPPTFEYEAIFVRAAGAGVSERLIRFLDLDGRTLALRYDFTASIARVAATTFSDVPPPLRFCYSGKVYRQEPERGARPREILQAGAELIGDPGLAADVEVVRLTIALLRSAGVAEFQINIGHVGVLAAGLAALDEARRADVRRWIDRKDRASLARDLADIGGAAETLITLPFVMGRRPELEAALATAPPDARPGLERLLALEATLTPEERSHVVFDLGEVRGLDYYTGMHFEVFVAGAGRAAGAGGRYDDLMGRFGRDLPAVGVSIDLDALAETVR